MKIEKIIISSNVKKYVKQRRLGKQFDKAISFMLLGCLKNINFKQKQPKSDEIYYFRINKQFRALAKLENNILKIYEIDNHQN